MTSFVDLAALAAQAEQAARPVVLIDGGSGAGKTVLARALVAAMRPGTQLVSLDDAYPGWHGLAAGAAMVPRIVGTDDPGFRRWDWDRDEPAGWVTVNDARPIVVEGCGALTPASAPLATSRVWCELDEATRKARALGRDGDGYAPWWDTWAAQERQHWRLHRPWELADVVVDAR